MSLHLHYHACEVCQHTVPYRRTGEKNLKMCPCADAFYCSSEHQEVHWKIHRRTCCMYKRKTELTAEEAAVKYLLQAHDGGLVEIGVAAHLKDDKNVDIRKALEERATIITIEPRLDAEAIQVPPVGGRVPSFQMANMDTIRTVSQAEYALALGLSQPFLQDAFSRTLRQQRGKLGITIIFEPIKRIITKSVPSIQMSIYEMMQEKEKVTTNPPLVGWHIMMMNNRLNMELQEQKEKLEKKGQR